MRKTLQAMFFVAQKGYYRASTVNALKHPPVRPRCLVRHRGGLDVHAHPPSVGRSLRSSNPVREGHGSPGTGASRTWRLGLWPEPSGVPRPCSVMPGCQTAGRSANG